MIAIMSKKKPVQNDKAEPVSTRIEPELLAALDQFCADQEFAPSRSIVIARALTDLLEKKGYWPPKDK